MSVNPAIAIWMFFIWLLSINSFCNVNGDTSCIESLRTLSEVLRCPNDEREWIRRAYIKNCSSIKQTCSDSHQFQYHCLLNEYGTRTIEVCAPVWYLLGFCASFKESKKRIGNFYDMKCSEFEVSCPDRFLSNESFKYQDCYTFPKNMKSPPTIEYSTKSSAEETLKLALSLGIGIPVLVAVVGVIIWRACINKRQSATQNKSQEAVELLEDGNNSPVHAEAKQDTKSEASSAIDYKKLAKSILKKKPEILDEAIANLIPDSSKPAVQTPPLQPGGTKDANFLNCDAQNASQIPEETGLHVPANTMSKEQESLILEAVRKTLCQMSEKEYNGLFDRINTNLIDGKSGKADVFSSADVPSNEPNKQDASAMSGENSNLDLEDQFGSDFVENILDFENDTPNPP